MGLSVPRRGDVYLVTLDPERGEEVHAARPCVIVSPDELNEHLQTYIVAPVMADGGEGSQIRAEVPFRVRCRVDQKDGYVVLDQIRTVDKPRLVRRLTGLSGSTLERVMEALREMFAE